MPKVVVYSTAVCPYCVRAKALLERKGVTYEEKMIEGDREAMGEVDAFIEVPPAPHPTAVVTSTVALQLFAYHVARLRGCAIDQPRNLAKSVTVE